MSNHGRRPVSSRASGGEIDVRTKADLELCLDTIGYDLLVRREPVAEGHPFLHGHVTQYFSVSQTAHSDGHSELLDNAYPGDRRDWQGMWDHMRRVHYGN